MFDPTIFDNIKVVLEGAIYEYDFQGEIKIVDRQDLIDLAVMERKFIIQYAPTDDLGITAEIQLFASTKDLASEILEIGSEKDTGCLIKIKYYIDIEEVSYCDIIMTTLREIWGGRPEITQKIIYQYVSEKINIELDKNSICETTMLFNRKINENNMDDIRDIIAFSIESLNRLENV